MHGIMADKMRRRDIFAYMYNQISTEMNKVYGEATDNITNHVIEMCADMQRQVQMIRGAESEASKVQPRDLTRVNEMVDSATRRLQELQDHAAPARRDARSQGWIE